MANPLDTLRLLRRVYRQSLLGRWLSPVRRFSRIAPQPGRRLCALTFDDGPTAGVTERLLEALADAGARGTFDVIGSTAENYPDRPGAPGTPAWNGLRYDHYAAFGRDGEAGVDRQPELARRLVAAGCELANHSYRHVQFAPERFTYRRRAHLRDETAVLADCRRLDEALRALGLPPPAFARPPHYVDGPAYEVYEQLGYQYLAASFDGGGWRPSSGSPAADARAMVEPLERALSANPDALDGQVIFQKDGYNMSLQAPVVAALPLQLRLLARLGYRVVTASELWAAGPFADVPGAAWPQAVSLAERGVPVAYRDNTLRPGQALTRGELAVWLSVLEQPVPPRLDWRPGDGGPRDVAPAHPYRRYIEAVLTGGRLRCDAGGYFRPASHVDAATWRAAGLAGSPSSPVERGAALRLLGES